MTPRLARTLKAAVGLLLATGALLLLLALLDPEGGGSSLSGEAGDGAGSGAKEPGGALLSETPRDPGAPVLRTRDGDPTGPSRADTKDAQPVANKTRQLRFADESGQPPVGVTVTMNGSGWSQGLDTSGAVQVPTEEAASSLTISGPGFETLQIETMHLEKFRPSSRLILQGTGVLLGHVRDINGEDLEGASVFALRPGSDAPVEDRPEWRALTGPDGAFRFSRLPPGKWDVRARLDGEAERPALEGHLEATVPTNSELALILGRARDIRGRVTTPDGKKPPGTIYVVMRGVRPDGGNGTVWSGKVASDGTFAIKDVGSGANMLWAWTSARESQLALTILRDVRPGTHDLHIPLVRGDVIKGTLVDDRGDVIRGGGWLYAFEGDVLVNGVSLGDDGTFETHLLPRGRVYDIIVRATSGQCGTVPAVAPGTSNLVVQARVLPALTGSVELPDGSLAGAGIQVQANAVGMGVDSREGVAASVNTDARGRFSFPKLGDFDYVVTAGGGAAYAPARVAGTARPGDDVVLRLRPPQRVTGRVLLSSAKPATGHTLWVVPEDGLFKGWSVTTDKKGNFQLGGLPRVPVRFMLQTLDGDVEVGRAVVPAEDLVINLPTR